MVADNGTGQSTSAILANQMTLVAAGESSEATTITVLGSPSIIYASQTRGVASSGPFDNFQLTSGGQITVNNGTPTGGSVIALVYHNHTTFQENVNANWWFWDTTTHAWSTNPFTIATSWTPISYAANAAIGTPVGNITTTMSDGSSFVGTLTLSDNTNFKLVGSQIQAKVVLSQASYSLTVTATPISLGVRYGPDGTATNTISQTGAVTAPAEAVAAGYNTLAFSDDFTNAATVSTNKADTFVSNPNAKWFWGLGAANNDIGGGNGCTVQTTWTAASIPLGQGAGSSSSPNGGILVMNGHTPWTMAGNNFIQTVPLSTSTVPSQGAFKNFCVEFYIAYDPAVGLGATHNLNWLNGYPALWSWTVEGMDDGNYGAFGPLTAHSTEVDFFEDYSGSFTWPQGKNVFGYLSPGASGTKFGNGDNTTSDNKWHRISFVWDQSGNFLQYKDGVKQGSTCTAATIAGASSIINSAGQHLFLIMGTGLEWPVYIDYVRVWTV